jgi:hypothetical protein
MDDYNAYSAMQTGEPVARFQKTILGKVHVLALDPFQDKPVSVILSGRAGTDESYIEIWTKKALVFFERMNKRHFNAGRLANITEPPKEAPSPNQISDEEIDVLLDPKKTKFLALKAKLEKFTETPPVFRILNRARELEASEKIIKHIEERMAKVELQKYGVSKE